MKKYISRVVLIIILCLVICGCGNITDTPSGKVELFMSKYQRLDSEVLAQLDRVVSNNIELTDSQKEDYRSLMERQYQDLSYKIKDENTLGENSTVTVEIEVYDYRSSLNKSEDYFEKNREEFTEGDVIDTIKYMDYKIKQMKTTEDRVKYEIIFTLHKEDGKWVLEDISDMDREKIHGLYIM